MSDVNGAARTDEVHDVANYHNFNECIFQSASDLISLYFVTLSSWTSIMPKIGMSKTVKKTGTSCPTDFECKCEKIPLTFCV